MPRRAGVLLPNQSKNKLAITFICSVLITAESAITMFVMCSFNFSPIRKQNAGPLNNQISIEIHMYLVNLSESCNSYLFH